MIFPKVGIGKIAIKNFDVLNPISKPEKFGLTDQHKVEIGSGAIICMAGDILPVDEKNWYVPVWLI